MFCSGPDRTAAVTVPRYAVTGVRFKVTVTVTQLGNLALACLKPESSLNLRSESRVRPLSGPGLAESAGPGAAARRRGGRRLLKEPGPVTTVT